MKTYKVKYYAATYSGVREVTAEDSEEAVAKVRSWVRRGMTLPMYSDGYEVISEEENDDEE